MNLNYLDCSEMVDIEDPDIKGLVHCNTCVILDEDTGIAYTGQWGFFYKDVLTYLSEDA